MTGRGSRCAAAAVTASLLAEAVGACGSSGGTSTASVTKTVTTTAPAASATSSAATPASQGTSSTGTSAAGSAAKTKGIPDYQPSSVVSKSAYATVLSSPDAVSKVGAFYRDVLAKGGWQVRSGSSSAYSASFIAHRDSQGATISVYPRGSGSGISITTHPE